jgi:prepilin-type N-terminal cleavage/methylation domain-containing protein
MNKGMSLLEVTIGMALFSILMVLVIETTLSIRDFSANYEESIELEEEGRRIIKQVTADFSNSAWYNNGGDVFPDATRTISALTYGNSVKFLRIRSNGSDTLQVGIAPFDFNTRTSRMSEWKTPSSTVPGLVVNEGYVPDSNPPIPLPLQVSQTWEPKAGSRSEPLSFDENNSLSNLRVYRYWVDPANNSIGRGVLKRQYTDTYSTTGDSGFQDDDSLGDLGRHIHWFIIQPDQNTQRVRLFLELRGPEQQSGKAVAVRRFSTIIAMRSMK